ncbi:uncharacterized protein LOC143038338 [Oratosquilla oratoria]|uniref:uncharacterized protein LOC143038338 n=1 Tax=Oratosquilla oratoria TaxID=337810 RepID=UPI003F76B3A3
MEPLRKTCGDSLWNPLGTPAEPIKNPLELQGEDLRTPWGVLWKLLGSPCGTTWNSSGEPLAWMFKRGPVQKKTRLSRRIRLTLSPQFPAVPVQGQKSIFIWFSEGGGKEGRGRGGLRVGIKGGPDKASFAFPVRRAPHPPTHSSSPSTHHEPPLPQWLLRSDPHPHFLEITVTTQPSGKLARPFTSRNHGKEPKSSLTKKGESNWTPNSRPRSRGPPGQDETLHHQEDIEDSEDIETSGDEMVIGLNVPRGVDLLNSPFSTTMIIIILINNRS